MQLSVLWLVGLYAIAFGAVMLALGWRLRGRRCASTNGGGYAGRMP